MKWLNLLEPIIQSEVSQKDKDKYRSLTHIYGIQKNGNGRIYLQGSNLETDIENRLMDMRRGEERVRRMERVTWKLTLPYVNRQPTGICCMTQEIQTGFCGNLQGWDGVGDERVFQQGGDIC